MKNKIVAIITLTIILLSFAQCNKNEKATGPDLELYNEATASTGFTFYQDNPAILTSSNPSAHNDFMRVKFNAIAKSALGLDGRLPVGASFPNGSLIVKELYDNQSGSIALYAVMKKDSTNPSAGVNWLWAEFNPDATVAFSVTENGSGCIGCHSTNSRDYSRVFNLF